MPFLVPSVVINGLCWTVEQGPTPRHNIITGSECATLLLHNEGRLFNFLTKLEEKVKGIGHDLNTSSLHPVRATICILQKQRTLENTRYAGLGSRLFFRLL
jgi:hypothetical protein